MLLFGIEAIVSILATPSTHHPLPEVILDPGWRNRQRRFDVRRPQPCMPCRTHVSLRVIVLQRGGGLELEVDDGFLGVKKALVVEVWMG